MKSTPDDFALSSYNPSFSPSRSVTKHRPSTASPPPSLSPLTLFPVPFLSGSPHSESTQAYTHHLSLPFLLSNTSLSPHRLYRPSNVFYAALSCSTLTDPPLLPPLSSCRLSRGGEGGSCFGLLMSGPSPWLHLSPSHSLLPHGGVTGYSFFHTRHPSRLWNFAHENIL